MGHLVSACVAFEAAANCGPRHLDATCAAILRSYVGELAVGMIPKSGNRFSDKIMPKPTKRVRLLPP